MGSKSRPSLPGQSLVPLLQGERVPQDHVFIQWHSAATVVEAVVTALGRSQRPGGDLSGGLETGHPRQRQRPALPPGTRPARGNLRYRQEAGAIMGPLLKKLEAWQRETGDRMALPEMG